MIPGPPQYYECPICKSLSSTDSLVSGNTFGSTLYSDMKRVSPMMPEFPLATICQNCDRLFWLNKFTRYDGSKDHRKIYYACFLDIQESNKVLETKVYDSLSQEYYLREQLLWRFNDRVRQDKSKFDTDEEKVIWRKNNERLLEILVDVDDVHSFFKKAEIFRNFGDFDKCFELFDSKNIENVHILKMIDQIVNHIEIKNTEVFAFNE